MKRVTFILAFLAALLFAACEQEVERPTYNGEGISASWMSSVQYATITADANTITVVMQRGVVGGAVEVPLTYGGLSSALINAPKSMSFGAGENEASVQLQVNVAQLNPAIANKISISIGGNASSTSAFKTITLNVRVDLTYKSIGMGKIMWEWWHEKAEWFDTDIEKADGFNIFRIPCPMRTTDGGEPIKDDYMDFAISQKGAVEVEDYYSKLPVVASDIDKYGYWGIQFAAGSKIVSSGVEFAVESCWGTTGYGASSSKGSALQLQWPASFTLEGVVPVAADSVRIVKINQKIVDGKMKADTVHHTRDTVFASKSITLKALIYPDTATSTDAGWKSLDATIATVDGNGKVTGKAEGTARIVAYDPSEPSVADTCFVHVKKIAAEKLKLSKNKLSIKAGRGAQLTASILPEDATNKGVIWSSSSPKVTFFEEPEGTILLMVAADATKDTVTVVAKSKDNAELSDTCMVYVAAAAAPVTPTVVPVTGVTLNAPTKELTVGEKFTLVATVAPAEATNKKVSWDSNNKPVATVDANGEVT
ncbi:MAG: Ig-like domain-containing protein, partial [Bacteroidales bacterium]|nr:Ig-like domain-containing protein [Bacteroidales bacterium]